MTMPAQPLVLKISINPMPQRRQFKQLAFKGLLYFRQEVFAQELPNDLADRAMDICQHYGYNFDYINFRRNGFNTFEMYHGDERTGYLLFIRENEID